MRPRTVRRIVVMVLHDLASVHRRAADEQVDTRRVGVLRGPSVV